MLCDSGGHLFVLITKISIRKEFILYPFTKTYLNKLLKEVQIKNAFFQNNTQEKLQNWKGAGYIHQIKNCQRKALLITVIVCVSHASQLISW